MNDMLAPDRQKQVSELAEFLRFASISADPKQKTEVLNCAKWLCRHLKKIGLQKVKLFVTRGHPIVYAEWITHPSSKTILFYGHYDVQPVAPASAWKYPPFQPAVVGDYIFARGASDDKGQLFIHIKAIERLLKYQKPAINIKCLFEGEEEIGSPNLFAFIDRHRQMLRCDVAVVSDTKMLSENIPAITYSLRGTLNAEITIKGHGKDLHSGTFGGMIFNPADLLSQIIGKINAPSGKIMIPRFYTDVASYDEQERLFMKRSGPRDEKLLSEASASRGWGENQFSNYERTTIRPSVVITGLQAGYTGHGTKNAIPTSATVKINMRLVKNQQPKKIAAVIHSFMKENIPQGFTYTIEFSSPAEPVEVSRKHPYMSAAAAAYKFAFNNPPVFLRSGGTIPVVSLFTHRLGIPVILMGFALATDNMHAPNEKFCLKNFFRGMATSVRFIELISAMTQRRQLSSPNKARII